jgi:DNA polymerase-3 subunit chi
MTRVDFAFDADSRLGQAARSTLRHVARGARVFVYCDETQRLNQFDQALWTIEDTAFVGREWLNDHPSMLDVPVYLVTQAAWPLVAQQVLTQDWLLNLDDDCPPEVTLFERVLEIVTVDDESKDLARQRWRQYQALGLELHAHQLGQPTR